MSDGTADKDWEEISDDAMAVEAAKKMGYRFEPAARPDRIEFAGPCPRCKHPFDYSWPLEIVRTALAVEAETLIPVTVLCQCTRAHAGRVEAMPHGCGAYWNLKVPRP